MLDLDIGGHDDCSTKLFGSQIPCYDGQWLLTSRYFKYWALLHSVSYFFFLYWSHSLSLSQVFDAISSNIDEVLLINLPVNMFVFVDLNVHHKDWLNYSGGTDRPGELCYSFSIYLAPMVNIHNQIPDWNYSDHIFVSVSIDFLPKSKTGCPVSSHSLVLFSCWLGRSS